MTVTEAEFTAVATGIHLGGLVADGDTVWYSDVIGGGVYRVAADGAVSGWLPERRCATAVTCTRTATAPGASEVASPVVGRVVTRTRFRLS